MKNHSQSVLKRGTRVNILVSDSIPYTIIDRKSGLPIGKTLSNDLGIYMDNVNFKVVDGQPTLEGTYKGDLEEVRLNLSEGTGVMFDTSKQAFTDGKKVIKSARMVQVYSGVIKVVI